MSVAEEMKKLAEENEKRLRAESEANIKIFIENRKKVGLELIFAEVKKRSQEGQQDLTINENDNVKLCEYIFDLQDDLRAEGFQVEEQKYAGKLSPWTMIVRWW